jgi:exopolyphosphatase / guanosine-5'-triphosphate,3'-diphosphate pyrophosphatase
MKIAAIDIGSNAVRLQIARINHEEGGEPFKKVEFVRIPIRLGDDAFNDGKISKAKRAIFYKAMQSFALMMDVYEVESYMACATSAMREAKNSSKIVDRVLEKTGININIINGKRESELILKSIQQHLKPGKSYLTIDVGGGSTEMTVINNKKAYDSVSFDVGTIRLLDNAVRKKSWDEIESYVKGHVSDFNNAEAIATSGTINKIAMMINPATDPHITTTQLEDFYKDVKKLSMKERIEKYKLNPDRADVIAPSASIYLKILGWGNIDKLHAPSAGLKDGILYELLEKAK